MLQNFIVSLNILLTFYTTKSQLHVVWEHKLNICSLKLVILLRIIYKLQYEEEKICELWKFKGMFV